MSGRPKADRWWLPTWRGVAVLLLLGLIVNLGVAVAIARWGVEPIRRGLRYTPEKGFTDNSDQFSTLQLEMPAKWPGPVPTDWDPSPAQELKRQIITKHLQGERIEQCIQTHATGWSTYCVRIGVVFNSTSYEVHRIGFPIGTLRYDRCWWSRSLDWGASGDYPIDPWRRGVVFYDKSPFPRMGPPLIEWTLPIYPVPLGLVVNTACYGVVIWMLVLVPKWYRRARRIRRGECAKCRYPLVPGRDVCPECGTAAPAGRSVVPVTANGSSGETVDAA